jgi:pimeloyl-ACP methyl ester carboxylesterase
MPHITASDDVKLHVTETGAGAPVVFVHEFGGDERSWEPQVRYFCRRYRCITFSARGYTPSDVPEDVAAYSQVRAVDDICDVMDGLGIERAHIVGLSMGGFATLHFGISYPERASSLVIAGAGYGAEKQHEEFFRKNSLEVAHQFETAGSEKFSYVYAHAAARIPFLVKDPRGFEEFRQMLGEHPAKGSANTMRGVQAARPSIYDLEDKIKQMRVPALMISGDEDDHCLQPALFLKRSIPASGLVVLPKTGHTINLEEPALFNWHVAEFLAQVEQGRWLPRDPRSDPAQIMKTD